MQEEWDKSYEKYLNDILPLIFDDKAGTKYDHNMTLYPKYRVEFVGNGRKNFVDRDGNKLFDMPLEDCDSFVNGIATIKNSEYKENITDEEGHILCDIWYDTIYSFHEGVAVVEKGKKYSAINDKGKPITKELFDKLESFSEGLAVACIGDKWFFIDKEGNHLLEDKIPPGYKAFGFHNGFAILFSRRNEKFVHAYIDHNGKILDNNGKGFDDAEKFENGHAVVKSDNCYYLIDGNGNQISEEKYDSYPGIYHNNMVFKDKNGGYIVLDSNGKRINKEPFKYYNECGNLSYVTIETRINKSIVETKYFLDKNGQISGKGWHGEVTHIKYSNFYAVKYETTRIVNEYGVPINNEEYDEVDEIAGKGVLLVKKGKKYYFLKFDGKYLLDYGFDEVVIYHDDITSKVKNNGKYNIINTQTGKLVLDKWVLRYPHSFTSTYSNHFIKCNLGLACIDIDMGDYKVDKNFSGYNCTNQSDSFIVKYAPIRLYGSLVLCHDKNNVYMYDKKTNTYETLGLISDIDYDDNFIINQRKRTVCLVYNNKLVDITDYYIKNIMGKTSVSVMNGVNLYNKDEFFQKNEKDIKNSYKEAEREKARLLEAQNRAAGLEQLYEFKKQIELKKKRLELLEQEARYQAQKYFKQLAEIAKEKGVVERQPLEGVIIEKNGTKYISPNALEPGIKELIDFSVVSLYDVVLSGVDLSNTNARIDPQKTLNNNMSNSNFEGVFFSVRFTFEGVDIRNSHFTTDPNPEAMSIRPESFIGAIYDDNTTLNGTPIGILLAQLEEEKDHGAKSA